MNPAQTTPPVPTPQTLRRAAPPAIDSVLLAAVRIATFELDQPLTNASGFFFARDERLYLVTSRHVVIDTPSKHFPNRITIEIHTDAADLGKSVGFSVLLYEDGQSVWRQGTDSAGEIDVAVLEIERSALPAGALFQAFTPAHLQLSGAVTTGTGTDTAPTTGAPAVEIGSQILIVGFPLGFQDTLHHLPVVRAAVVASAYGLRFQGLGYFLTDARTHRGTSGAPVVMRDHSAAALGDPSKSALPWKLLGVHSARLDMAGRDKVEDESLGLNCAWYADMLMTLTEPIKT